MAEIARWNEHVFTVSPELIYSFTDFTVKGASDTDDKNSSKQAFVNRKNAKPKEISIKVQLHAALGVDVQAEAMAFVDEASAGASDYFYVGGSKLLTCMMMLTEASVEEVVMTGGKWVSASVALTFKQSSKDDGGTNGSGGGGGGGSGGSKKTSVKTSKPADTNQATSKIGQAFAQTAAGEDGYTIQRALVYKAASIAQNAIDTAKAASTKKLNSGTGPSASMLVR